MTAGNHQPLPNCQAHWYESHTYLQYLRYCLGNRGESGVGSTRGQDLVRQKGFSGSILPSPFPSLSSLKSLELQSQDSLVPQQTGHWGGTNYAVGMDVEKVSTSCRQRETSWAIRNPWQGVRWRGMVAIASTHLYVVIFKAKWLVLCLFSVIWRLNTCYCLTFGVVSLLSLLCCLLKWWVIQSCNSPVYIIGIRGHHATRFSWHWHFFNWHFLGGD